MNDRKRTIDFLIDHPGFFIDGISAVYPLTRALVKKYKDYWNWCELGSNRNLPWSEDFYYDFEKYWDWRENDSIEYPVWINHNPHLPWSADFLERHKNKIQWYMISQQADGELFPWTLKLIDQFKEYWRWDFLSESESLPWSDQLIEKFRDYWDWEALSRNEHLPWSEELIHKYHDLWDWERLADNTKINWSDKMIIEYQDMFKVNTLIWLKQGRPMDNLFPEWDPDDLLSPNHRQGDKFTLGEMERILANPDWWRMSYNERIPWSIRLLEYYKDHWHWELLSTNPSLPWSEELIDKFIDRWEWGRAIPLGDGESELVEGLSYNPALPWSVDFIERYKDRWFWFDMSHNSAMPWSLALLESFQDYWDWTIITSNEDLWAKVFYKYLDPDMIDYIMSEIVKNKIGE